MALSRRAEDASPTLWRRVLWLDREMRAYRYPNYARLCETFSVSPRCATQTLQFMRKELGLRIAFGKRHGGYTYEGAPPELPALLPVAPVSEGELTALQIATSAARCNLDVETTRALARLGDRLLSLAEPAVRSRVGALADEVVFTGPPALRAPYLDRLRRAIRTRSVLEIDYRSPKYPELVTREIEPHFLINAGGDWLLVAWDRTQRGPRTFALARIATPPEPLGETFEPRPELEADAFTRHQFLSEGGAAEYELALRFAPSVAQLAWERTWHPSQQGERLADGSYELRLRVAGEGDVLRWILGFGRAVEVIAPERIRRLVAAEAAAIAAIYPVP